VREPKVEYGWGEIDGRRVRTEQTTYPPPTREQIVLAMERGVRTFGGGSVMIRFLSEPEADEPTIVEGE
jgi:hypothetical protein